jgi:outer membrane lipopolysaccharide assembly protein LptE/RlpB
MALAVTLAAACGYHLVGTSSSLPPQLKTLYVAPFVNHTTRAEVDQRLGEQVSQEWVRRGRLQLVASAEQADLVLSATVLAASSSPVQLDKTGRATEYQLVVVADVRLVDRTKPQPETIWRDKNFTRNVSYQVDVNALDYFDREIEAMDRLARDFARALVVTILEGF